MGRRGGRAPVGVRGSNHSSGARQPRCVRKILRTASFELYCRRRGDFVGRIETNARKIVLRLKTEDWTSVGGGSHHRFVHTDRPEMMIVVPRHRELSPGVARSIAKAAG